MRRLGVAVLLVLLVPTVGAQAGALSVQLNEIYASHTGTDTVEFIELIGTPGMTLDDVVVVIVEGDGPTGGRGTVDRVWDLSGLDIPGDGYFVLGDTAVPNVDFNIGTSDRIENGTETFYLLTNADGAGLTGLLSTDLDGDDDGFYDSTAIGDYGTIQDLVAMVDSGITAAEPGTDRVYDGAEIRGPDGTFFPSGIYRGPNVSLDWPSGWATTFLNFDPATIGGTAPDRPTPGEANIPEPATLALLSLGGLLLVRRRR